MKFKVSKLDYDNGCYGCRKSCNFNGLRVSAESVKAVKKDKYGIRTMPKSAEMYGCNSVREANTLSTVRQGWQICEGREIDGKINV